jgi:tetratricopeptide (TPR) repeat protein
VQQAGRGRYNPIPHSRRVQRIGGWITLAVGTFPITVLVMIGLVFPLVGTPSRINNRIPGSQELTLDGLAFFEYGEFTHNGKTVYLQPDGEAIAWLNEHIVGTPIVLQSGLSFYREYGIRIAANTGFPTVVSSLHENEQRDPEDVGIRDRDMDTIYRSTDSNLTLQLLQKYRVNYVYVGSVERAFYPAEGLAKFATVLDPFLDLVYENPGVQIYRVRNIPQPYPMPPSIEDNQDNEEEITLNFADLPGPIPEDDETLKQEDTKTLELYYKLSPTNARLARILAARYEKLNRFDDAVNVLETYIKTDPKDVLMLHVLGDVLARDGQLDAAEDVYREAANSSMKSADWDKLGRELLAWGRLDKAELALIRAITIEPVDTPAYYHLAETYIQQGNTRQAIKYLEIYLQAAPDGYLVDSAQTLLKKLQEQ